MARTTELYEIVVSTSGQAEVRKLVSELSAANKSLRATQQQMKTAGSSTRDFSNAQRDASKSQKLFALQMQNLGYQVQDFAVQTAAGTGALRALGQQLPQAASGFGIWGTAIGTALAVLTPLLALMIDFSSQAEKTADSMKALGDASTEVQSAFTKLQQVRGDFVKAIGSGNSAAISALEIELRLRQELTRLEINRYQLSQIAAQANLATSKEELRVLRERIAEEAKLALAQYANAEKSLQGTGVRDFGVRARLEQVIKEYDAIKAQSDELRQQEITYELTNNAIEAMKESIKEVTELLENGGEGAAEIASELATTSAYAERFRAEAELMEQSLTPVLLTQKQINDAIKVAEAARREERKYITELADIQSRNAEATKLISEGNTRAAKSFLESADAAKELEDRTLEIFEHMDISREEAERFAAQLIDAEDSADRIARYLEELSDASTLAEKSIANFKYLLGGTIEVARNLRDALREAMGALGGVGTGLVRLVTENPIIKATTTALGAIGNSSSLQVALAKAQLFGENLVRAAEDVDKNSRKGSGGKSGASALEEADKALKSFVSELEKYRDDAEAAKAAQEELTAQYEIFKDKLTPEQVKLYNRAIAELQKEIDKLSEDMQKVADIISGNMESAFDSIINGTKSTKEAFTDMITGMLKDLAKLVASRYFQQFASTLVGNLPGGFNLIPTAFQAKGGVWQNGIQTFAQGGIVTAPTLFRAANGVGLMGEAGSEAIVPLTRRGGRLGVEASPVNVNVYNSSGTEATVEERNTMNGREIDIYIENRVKTMFGSGKLDKPMQMNYGLRRRA